jgi:peroxin-19
MVPSMNEILSVFKELSKEGQSGGLATSTPSSSSNATAAKTSQAKPSSLSDHVSRTMNKLKQSDSQVESELAAQAQDDPALEMLMKELEGMMQGGDLDNVLGGLMDQILSKELLHEPMKDLASKVRPLS